MHSVRALTLVLGLAGALAAQNRCPHLRPKSVPASWTSGPSVTCSSGVDMTIGAVRVQSGHSSCPLFVIISPTHDEPEPTSAATRVVDRGSVAELAAYFTCMPHYFLIFRTSDTCEYSHTETLGQLRLLDTELCDVQVLTQF